MLVWALCLAALFTLVATQPAALELSGRIQSSAIPATSTSGLIVTTLADFAFGLTGECLTATCMHSMPRASQLGATIWASRS
ncbi:unnamed protein product [Polarella glacialis]|uniref:Uncharacterized protein n=1 Tax=Polarella glacialis TaxID=89957 RepID=A0A813G3I8_POLGL|nr:unnamed protein product [Polarella glacialis]